MLDLVDRMSPLIACRTKERRRTSWEKSYPAVIARHSIETLKGVAVGDQLVIPKVGLLSALLRALERTEKNGHISSIYFGFSKLKTHQGFRLSSSLSAMTSDLEVSTGNVHLVDLLASRIFN